MGTRTKGKEIETIVRTVNHSGGYDILNAKDLKYNSSSIPDVAWYCNKCGSLSTLDVCANIQMVFENNIRRGKKIFCPKCKELICEEIVTYPEEIWDKRIKTMMTEEI